MRRITLNALVDIGCLITFIPSLVSGLVLFFFLPSGNGGGGGSHAVYLNLARPVWLNMHNYWSLAFAVLLIVHLLLHWMYFRNIRKCFRPGTAEADECKT